MTNCTESEPDLSINGRKAHYPLAKLRGDIMELSKLFEPGSIGAMEVKNRIVMAPMAVRLCSESGAVTQRFIDFYVERAKGGTGLIILENTCVDWPLGKAGDFPVRLDSDRFIHGFHDLADAVHPYGAKLATQLQHAGRQTHMDATEGLRPVTSSVLPGTTGTLPRKLTIPEIHEIEEKFAQAALRTKAAGFDAVEIHGAHGYLVTQFLSPFMNRRTDMYGGSLENRVRFAVEMVERVREKVGPDFPIIFRLSADEYVPGGIELEEAKLISLRLEEAGVDALHVSAGVYEVTRTTSPPTMVEPRGCYVHLAAGVRQVVNVPVIAVGRINNPVLAEEILEQGKADFIALGRQLLADPYFPDKAARGAWDDIRPCIACNQCIGRLIRHWRIGCCVNAETGRERETQLRPVDGKKKILVAGGGPAGMEAARVAALRGHEVSLYERSEQLGGQLLLASVPSFKKEIEEFIRYQVRQLDKVGVRVERGREVTRDLVKRVKPDVIIMATGARPLIPHIDGIDREEVVTAEAVLGGTVEVGKSVLVAGGGKVGVEMACHLAEQGRAVTLVEMTEEIGADLEPTEKVYFPLRLKRAAVTLLTERKVDRVTKDGVEIVSPGWEKELIPAETLVLALGAESDDALAQGLAGLDVEVYAIGDCVKPGSIYEAVHDGFRVGCEV